MPAKPAPTITKSNVLSETVAGSSVTVVAVATAAKARFTKRILIFYVELEYHGVM